MKRAPLKLELRIARGNSARGGTTVPRVRDLTLWAAAALGRQGAGRELAVRLVSPAESRRLNRDYRGKDRPTNVLSFPTALPPHVAQQLDAQPLGDLVLCPAVLAREAQEQGKRPRAHWAHLVVHGSLHLIGYDHEQPGQAQRMERREVAVLRRLGFPNPYVVQGAMARAA